MELNYRFLQREISDEGDSMELIECIQDIRTRLKSDQYPSTEQAIRVGIVDRILSSLGWKTFDPLQVYPEYPIEGGGRVDYALFYPASEPRVFIEAKKLGTLERTGQGPEEQLFEYDSRVRVPIAVLTDGKIWRFFYPPGTGTWADRKVKELNLAAEDSQENVEYLEKCLSCEEIQIGRAEEAIKQDYEDLEDQRRIARYLPDAWENLLKRSDELLIELIAEETEKLCSRVPSNEQVLAFLNSLKKKKDPPRPPTQGNYMESSKPTQRKRQNRNAETRLRVTMSDQTEIRHDKALDTFCEVLQIFGLERVHEIEPGVVSKGPFDNGKHRQVDGYWINTNNGSGPKRNILKRIAQKLGINLDVEVIPK